MIQDQDDCGDDGQDGRPVARGTAPFRAISPLLPTGRAAGLRVCGEKNFPRCRI